MDENSSCRPRILSRAIPTKRIEVVTAARRRCGISRNGSIMRIIALLLLISPAFAIAQSPPFQPAATVAEIMSAITLPYSDALVYIQRNPPKNDWDWEMLQRQALMLAESGNLLMMKDRARNQGEWMKDARLLVDAGIAAVKAT